MKKSTWIPLIIIIVGICLAGAGFAAGGWGVIQPGIYVNKDGLHAPGKVKLATVDETYDASKVKILVIDANYLNRVSVKEGEAGGKITVRGANYETNGGLTAQLKDDALTVTTRDPDHRGGWLLSLDFAGVLNNDNCYLEITVPKGVKLDALTADIDASDIELGGFSAVAATIDNNYGDIDLRSIQADSLTIKADAGNIEAGEITVTGLFDIDSRYGNIVIRNAKAGDLTTRADAGNIRAEDIQATNVSVDNHYGDITLGRLTLSRLCTVECDAGSVSIALTNAESEVGYDLTVDAGTISAGGRTQQGTGDISLNSPDLPNERAHVTANNNLGNIKLEFGRYLQESFLFQPQMKIRMKTTAIEKRPIASR